MENDKFNIPNEMKYPFYFYRENSSGGTEFIVLTAAWDMISARNDFGVEGGRLGNPSLILKPDVDVYNDDDIRVFGTEKEALAFIADWFKMLVEKYPT